MENYTNLFIYGYASLFLLSSYIIWKLYTQIKFYKVIDTERATFLIEINDIVNFEANFNNWLLDNIIEDETNYQDTFSRYFISNTKTTHLSEEEMDLTVKTNYTLLLVLAQMHNNSVMGIDEDDEYYTGPDAMDDIDMDTEGKEINDMSIEELREELEKSLIIENYEKASLLRDMINKKENK
jgi:hypothetical protein